MALPAVGSLVAEKYCLEALLGEGGMGAVFRARHVLMDAPVALKWLRPDRIGNQDASRRLVREARSIARVRHPNVVQVYDMDVHEGAAFMVMELLEGDSFADLIEADRLPVQRAIQLLIAAMHGCAAAHQHGIIHRDIKPENIFVVRDRRHPDGLAKLLDFGISKLDARMQAGPTLTQSGQTVGTPLYMSLEQLTSASDIDVRTDVYSFGVVLYQALTGRLPFMGETFPAVVLSIASSTPPSPRELRPELSTSLDWVVMKAMARKREDRYPSIAALIAALRGAERLHQAAAKAPASARVGPAAGGAGAATTGRSTPTVVATRAASEAVLASEQAAASAAGQLPSDTVVAAGEPARAVGRPPSDAAFAAAEAARGAGRPQGDPASAAGEAARAVAAGALGAAWPEPGVGASRAPSRIATGAQEAPLSHGSAVRAIGGSPNEAGVRSGKPLSGIATSARAEAALQQGSHAVGSPGPSQTPFAPRAGSAPSPAAAAFGGPPGPFEPARSAMPWSVSASDGEHEDRTPWGVSSPRSRSEERFRQTWHGARGPALALAVLVAILMAAGVWAGLLSSPSGARTEPSGSSTSSASVRAPALGEVSAPVPSVRAEPVGSGVPAASLAIEPSAAPAAPAGEAQPARAAGPQPGLSPQAASRRAKASGGASADERGADPNSERPRKLREPPSISAVGKSGGLRRDDF